MSISTKQARRELFRGVKSPAQHDKTLKIEISGGRGSGKTTLLALLANKLTEEGYRIVASDESDSHVHGEIVKRIRSALRGGGKLGLITERRDIELVVKPNE